ncbi:MAG: hypothetical protein H2184_07860 [Candidatus Galacturonibacter soehngenii]|nr:hypothetical protein [Candidatus Galacturonibacter soehngenii]
MYDNVSSQLLFKIYKINLIDAFEKLSEMEDEDELINFYLLKYRGIFSELELNMFKYEIDRNKIKKENLNERFENARFIYNYPVQKIYKDFLIDSESYQTWKNINYEKTEVINNVKKNK